MLLHSTFRLRNYQRIDQCIENLLKRTHIYTHRILSLYLRALPNISKHTKTDNRSQNIALEDNCPPIPKLTLTKTLTLTRGQFPSGAIVWLPPNTKTNSNLDRNPNPNLGGNFAQGSNCPGTVSALPFLLSKSFLISLRCSRFVHYSSRCLSIICQGD